ncbi:MAG: NADH:ubiquinone oxidoreductase [Rhodobacteraceae bacterium PARR1]|nr:MAG: NADH:ubiquinone oxidoreductase [Rhodobacteraceae bacterium PARR1]
MTRRDPLNAPSLNGAVISALFALIALGVAKVVGGFDWTPAVFFAAVVFAAAAVFLVLPWGGASAKAAEPVAHAAPKAQPVTVAAAVAPLAAPVAAPVAEVAPVASDAGSKPAGLAAPRAGQADDLKTLEGIGPALEKLCNELGIWHFDQIANWGDAEIAWMDSNLKGFKGRVTRDKWVAQAKLIGSVGVEEFLRRAKTNDY